jgi:hypothetical protein
MVNVANVLAKFEPKWSWCRKDCGGRVVHSGKCCHGYLMWHFHSSTYGHFLRSLLFILFSYGAAYLLSLSATWTLSLTSAPDGVGDQRHALVALPPGKWTGTHCTGNWVDPRAGLDGCGNLAPPGFEPRTLQPVVSRYTEYAVSAGNIIIE